MQGYTSAYEELVRKLWIDETFRNAFIATPIATLREEGWELPAGVEVKLSNGPARLRFEGDTLNLAIPPRPACAMYEEEKESMAQNAVATSEASFGECFICTDHATRAGRRQQADAEVSFGECFICTDHATRAGRRQQVEASFGECFICTDHATRAGRSQQPKVEASFGECFICTDHATRAGRRQQVEASFGECFICTDHATRAGRSQWANQDAQLVAV